MAPLGLTGERYISHRATKFDKQGRKDAGSGKGGTRAVAFEVGPPDASESLIRRHPPRKFQRLEDQQQGNTITQEKLEEKQATAERRRQEILTQRVQSAKHRSATRMRPHPDDADEVEKVRHGKF
ncbi:hypothetical protein E2C01_050383 [Portunus trituberculatus]|uniref:Uncharacterized protein n=1 Tax=Portunus trituberculatus TaxID=210409 RepID=A0A5B7GBY1_PORTR|nr:hypothetical protein [Portunus trituberculatus]